MAMPRKLELAYGNFMQKTLMHSMLQGTPVPPIYILRKDTNRGAEHAITHSPDLFLEDGYRVVKYDNFSPGELDRMV